ncbi:glycoside hydrolase family 3 protein [candidate division KSB1 bacterium]|nr:glycoside hydrolase family 3 protein [candidate division KSB1 bacterium]
MQIKWKNYLRGFVALALVVTARAQDQKWVERTLANMTLEEKVGQLFVADLVAIYSHKQSPIYRYAEEMVRRYHVGAFILGGGTLSDIALITNALQREAKIPLLINSDLESGLTYYTPWWWARGRMPELPRFISGGGTGFPSMMAFGATGDPKLAYEFGRAMAREARAVGIHWTNSPVADVNNNPNNSIINTRSFGEDPAQVAKFVAACVRGLQDGGVIATLKHFPGHGDTEEDTHMKLPILPFDEKRLNAIEFVSFKAGIAAGTKAVMTAHLALPKIDSTKRPATLSNAVITGLLRNKLRFQGLVVTDGMPMQGITDHYGADEAAILAIEAGVDAILVPAEFVKACDGVFAAVQSGRISRQRLDESVRRILAVKSWLGLDRSRLVEVEKISELVAAPETEALADKISDASVTLLRNQNRLLPLPATTRLKIVAVSEEPYPEFGRELLRQLESQLATVSLTHLSNESSREFIQRMAQFDDADVILLGVYLSIGAWKGKPAFSPAVQDFFAQVGALSKPVITIAFGDPYVIGKLPATAVIMTPYNGAKIGERAIAKAILGTIDITGKLPVTIPGKYKIGDGLKLLMKK